MILLSGCVPILPDTTFLVDEPRVLAVRVEPPEAEAGVEVGLEALYADADGPLDAALSWSFCGERKPLAELGPVARTCLDPASAALVPIGTGLAVTATIPNDACSQFGPNPPAPQAGQPSGRPADPDVTGGFYDPALVFDDDQATLVPVRVRCGIANVAQDTYIAWNTAYVSNANPAATLDAPATATPGETVTLTVDLGASAEAYVVYDPISGDLLDRREAISVTWFTTGGEFAVVRNGRAGDETATTVDDAWTAPDAAGDVWLAAVVRDERGGVAWATATVEVSPF